MTDLTRRGLLAGSAALGTAGVLTTGVANADVSKPAPVTVTPDDPRYADLMLRGNNARFQAEPDWVSVAGSTSDVVDAVRQAVRTGRRIVVRSGGHCYEDFVDSQDTRALVDLARLNEVGWDERMRAFLVEPGATLEQVYKTLYYGWGVTLPGGGCASVGAGGHFCGGGYGPLSRRLGSIVDYIYAVEVVVVDRGGRAKAVVATREPNDPHHDLWWAHTGGGGGNFGIVTKYWMRSREARGSDPGRALPKPPPRVLTNFTGWSWQSFDRATFVRLMKNYAGFFERNSAPDSPYNGLWAPLLIGHHSGEGNAMATVMDASVPDARKLLEDFQTAVFDGVDVNPIRTPIAERPWLTNTLESAIAEGARSRFKGKSAYLKKSLTDKQLETAYSYLTSDKYGKHQALFWLLPYGGKVNEVSSTATAMPQRDSVIKVIYGAGWEDPGEDAAHIAWVREFYRDVYAETGGVPVPNEVSDGSYVNYADVDLADPEWNKSGVPWHSLYYQGNYPRLRRIKAKYDPRNVFHHKLSITAG